MRSLKSRGNITRGCGVTEFVRVLRANTAHRCGAFGMVIKIGRVFCLK